MHLQNKKMYIMAVSHFFRFVLHVEQHKIVNKLSAELMKQLGYWHAAFVLIIHRLFGFHLNSKLNFAMTWLKPFFAELFFQEEILTLNRQ